MLPPFTLEAVYKSARSPDPARFYLPENPDFVEHADLTLLVQGKQLPAHSQIMAARAPVFAPLMMHPPTGPLADPFGIDRLDALLVLLRLCYQPEAAAEGLRNCLSLVPELLPTLHRVNATHFLASLDLASLDLAVADLLRWVDASVHLPGLEHFAAECAALVVNGLADSSLRWKKSPADQAFVCLDMRTLPLELLSPAGQALLCRTAMAAVADARSHGSVLSRSAKRRRGEAIAKDQEGQHAAGPDGSVRQLVPEAVRLLASGVVQGSHSWHLPDIADDDDAEPEPVVSEPFTLPLEDRFASLWLEAVEPAALPAQGMEAYVSATVESCAGEGQPSIQQRQRVNLTRDAAAVAFQPLASHDDCLGPSYDPRDQCFRFRLRVDLAVAPLAGA